MFINLPDGLVPDLTLVVTEGRFIRETWDSCDDIDNYLVLRVNI